MATSIQMFNPLTVMNVCVMSILKRDNMKEFQKKTTDIWEEHYNEK